MKAAQTVTAEVPTKAGPVAVVVNVIATGNDDGAVAVMRDVAAHVMRAARFDGRAVASPEKRLPDGTVNDCQWTAETPYVSARFDGGILVSHCFTSGDGVADDDGMRRDFRE